MAKQIFSSREIENIYNKWAPAYDKSMILFHLAGFRERAYRRAAVENLNLKPGDTVVDLGCGTGLNFGLLQEKIGPEGTIIGVDLTESMLEQARHRIKQNRWTNVELVQCDMAKFNLPAETDAVLSTLALTMSPDYDRVVKSIANSLKAGGRMSIFELKRPEGWPDWLVQLMIGLLHSYGTRAEHTKRKPWRSIEKYFGKTQIQEYYLGAVYVAMGESQK